MINDFSDPYDKRRACEEDYISPPFQDEEILYTEVVSSSSDSNVNEL